MSSSSDICIDVRELNVLLQCLGFKKEWNISEEEGSPTVVISCQEFGGALLKSLVKSQRERLLKGLQEIVRCIKDHNEIDVEKKQESFSIKFASMLDLKTPEQRPEHNYETPTRSRSLDTLSTKDYQLPTPKAPAMDKKYVCRRQRSNTFSSISETSKFCKEISSPTQVTSQSILNKLLATEEVVADLRNTLSNVIKEGKLDFSMFSLNLDVSKKSVSKGSERPKIIFASTPNLFDLGESASISNLAAKPTPEDIEIQKLKQTYFFLYSPNISNTTDKSEESKGDKLDLSQPKMVPEPVQKSTINSDGNPNLCDARKKFGHVTSSIPRLVTKK